MLASLEGLMDAIAAVLTTQGVMLGLANVTDTGQSAATDIFATLGGPWIEASGAIMGALASVVTALGNLLATL